MLWHKETSIENTNLIVLPGGFSHGDYLRSGSIASRAPIMKEVIKLANNGTPVIGICNGFQILCEAGLLPGILLPNSHTEYRCVATNLVTLRTDTSFTELCRPDQVLQIPVSHGEGNFQVDSKTLNDIENSGKVVFRYCDTNGNIDEDSNPNGSITLVI